MADQPGSTSSIVFNALGDFRWIRAHVSTYAVGAILLVIVNVIIGGARLWSLTAIGIWSMLIIVHLVLLAISRLSTQLLADDDEEVVLLPGNDPFIIDPAPNPEATWKTPREAAPKEGSPSQSSETVSWQIATDVAQAKRQNNNTEQESS